VHVPTHVSVVPFGVQMPVKFAAEQASPALLLTQAWSIGTQTPLAHARPLGQTFPQVPQFMLSARRLISQPSAARFPLQFANPALHVPVHTSADPVVTQVPW